MRVSDLSIDRIYINSQSRASSYHMVENHFHHYYECFYVRQGNCRFFINGDLCDLSPGEMLIIPPGNVHFNNYLTTTVRINIYFRESDLIDNGEPFFPELENRLLRIVKIHLPSSYRDLAEHSIDQMLSEEKINGENTPVMMKLIFRQFLLNLTRFGIFHYDHMDEPSARSGDSDIIKVSHYISEHYSEKITLSSMSAMAGLSPSYFSRKFNQVTGMGMKEFLNYVRLEAASVELCSTRHSITDVALNCGFSDSNYFKDVFKKMYGLSPRAYRNLRGKTDIKNYKGY